MKVVLRPYQERAVAQTWARLGEGFKAPLIVAPTGAGKTIIGCRLIEDARRNGARALFIAHRTELIEQCSAKLDEIGLDHGIIKSGLDRGSLADPVQVCSVQTFVRRSKNLPRHYRVIIIDECHHAAASTYQQVIEHCTIDGQRPIVIGLTATPYRSDGKGLGSVFDSMVEVTTTAELIADGFLVPYRVFRAKQTPNLDGLSLIGGDFNEKELAERMNRRALNGHVVSEWMRLAGGRTTALFAVDVAHSKAICAAFVEAGIRAEHVDGETPAEERRAILGRVQSGRTLILCNCGVATEGWDCPRCSCVVFARPTMSRCLWRQQAGRALRIAPELLKTDCLILDHAGLTERHGYLTDPDIVDLERGIAREKPASTSRCEHCGASFARRPPVCPECGCKLAVERTVDPMELGDPRFALGEDTDFAMAGRRTTPRPYIPTPPRPLRLRARRAT